MDNGVLQQITQHLLDEHRIHGHKQHLLRRGNGKLHLRVVLAEFPGRLVRDLLRRLRGLFDLGLAPADAGDGQQVFHHAHQPIRVLPGLLQKDLLILLPHLRVIQHQSNGAGNGGEGRAQIMGHGPQQVGPHLLPLGLQLQLLLLLDMCGQGAGAHRHGQHGHEGERIAGDGEVKFHIRICKYIVNTQHGDEGGGDAADVALGEAGHHQHAEYEKQRHIGVSVAEIAQNHAQNGGKGQRQRRHRRVP